MIRSHILGKAKAAFISLAARAAWHRKPSGASHAIPDTDIVSELVAKGRY
jgi:hypothetical protein